MHNVCKHMSRPACILITESRGAISGSIENPIAFEKESSIMVALQDNALLVLLLLGQESRTCGVFENFTDTFIGLC